MSHNLVDPRFARAFMRQAILISNSYEKKISQLKRQLECFSFINGMKDILISILNLFTSACGVITTIFIVYRDVLSRIFDLIFGVIGLVILCIFAEYMAGVLIQQTPDLERMARIHHLLICTHQLHIMPNTTTAYLNVSPSFEEFISNLETVLRFITMWILKLLGIQNAHLMC